MPVCWHVRCSEDCAKAAKIRNGESRDAVTTANIRFAPIVLQHSDAEENEMRVPRGYTAIPRHLWTGAAANACVWPFLAAIVLVLAGCYPASYREVPPPAPKDASGSAPAPMQQLYFYPKNGQTMEKQSRDHYECYNWAVNQTGFEPGQSAIPQDQRVRVVPMPPPGYDTATFAIAGAVLGALFGGPHYSAQGAIVGGAAGAIAGAASDSARQESARQMNESYAARDRQREAQLNAKALDFRRAMSACMEGRGYSVH